MGFLPGLPLPAPETMVTAAEVTAGRLATLNLMWTRPTGDIGQTAQAEPHQASG